MVLYTVYGVWSTQYTQKAADRRVNVKRTALVAADNDKRGFLQWPARGKDPTSTNIAASLSIIV